MHLEVAMNTPRARVVRASDAPIAGGVTPGMERREIASDDRVWVGWVRTEPGVAGGWHTHGERDTYVYVIDGSLRIDFGPGGRESVDGRAGDVVFNPARMVHREVTGPDGPVEAFVVRVGSGPPTINVDGPDPEVGPRRD
jgi:uncharacterized RmlC-like cupin family protein